MNRDLYNCVQRDSDCSDKLVYTRVDHILRPVYLCDKHYVEMRTIAQPARVPDENTYGPAYDEETMSAEAEMEVLLALRKGDFDHATMLVSRLPSDEIYDFIHFMIDAKDFIDESYMRVRFNEIG